MIIVWLMGLMVVNPVRAQGTMITLDPSITYQTMTGWQADAYAADWPGHNASYPAYINDLLDEVVFDLGISRLRVGIMEGAENNNSNNTDWWVEFENGVIDEYEYVHNPGYCYQIIDDNYPNPPDPFTTNQAAFKWTALDHQFDAIVMPMKQRLESIDRPIHISLTYGGARNGDTAFHADNPEEYAEFALATYQHLQSKYNVIPDTWDIVNEPDNSNPYWNATKIGQIIAASGNRLQANGFIPRFIAPSTASAVNAVSWFNTLVNVPGASNYVTALAYHTYSGANDINFMAIGNTAATHNVDTVMTEHWRTPYTQLHEELKLANNSSWSGAYSLAGNYDYLDHYHIDSSHPKGYIMNDYAKYTRNYYKYVLTSIDSQTSESLFPIRIEAAINGCGGDQMCDSQPYDPVAFVNPGGEYTVVVKVNNANNPFVITNLPNGQYGIMYSYGTSGSDLIDQSRQWGLDAPDVTITNNSLTINPKTNLNSSFNAGVITVYGKTGGSTLPTPISTPVNFKQWLTSWLTPTDDQNGDGKVNSLDWGKLIVNP
jgi:hypothetical protein